MANPNSEGREQVDLAEYIFTRLVQLGLGSVHGVPGDYNLTILDYVKPAGLNWVGNANELNSGYAADGYGRIKGIAAMVTSYGVGDLSAINAIGGAYGERSPVVHLVGTPPTAAQDAGACLHHSLGDGKLRIFAEMNKFVNVAQANLTDVDKAPALVDATLKACVLNSRPVYIELPTNLVHAKVPAPTSPIDLSVPGYDEDHEAKIVSSIVEAIQKSTKPMIFMGGLAARFRVTEELNEFVRLTGFPTVTMSFGKGIVNESLPNYQGVYMGAVGDTVLKEQVDAADLVLDFGPMHSDVNSFGFTAVPKANVTITIDQYSVKFFGQDSDTSGRVFSPKSFMTKLLKSISAAKLPTYQFNRGSTYPPHLLQNLKPSPDEAKIEHDAFWLRMSNFLQSGDTVLVEAGTAIAGACSMVLPDNVTVMNSGLWLSIGFTLPALQGAALARREQRRAGSKEAAGFSGRSILFIGDGSLQMSVQGISDIIRNRLDATIIVINNDGYTVERYIHGFNEGYNDIQPWRHTQALSFFGAPLDDPEYPVITEQAKNWGQLRSLLARKDVQKGKGLALIEVFMELEDAPLPLKNFAGFMADRNKTNGKN
ncbi:thiamine diphosphate-binding protein [Trichoderma austrokoningii]